jgi:hypothetical protein
MYAYKIIWSRGSVIKAKETAFMIGKLWTLPSGADEF